MKLYTTQDVSAGYVAKEDRNLSLLEVSEITDWHVVEFDEISDLGVNQSCVYDGIKVIRTE